VCVCVKIAKKLSFFIILFLPFKRVRESFPCLILSFLPFFLSSCLLPSSVFGKGETVDFLLLETEKVGKKNTFPPSLFFFFDEETGSVKTFEALLQTRENRNEPSFFVSF